MNASTTVGRFLVWAIVLALFASTVTIYAAQNPQGIGWPPLRERRGTTPVGADARVDADVVGWVLGPGNTVQGLVISWTPPAESVYALRIYLKDEAGGLLATASCKAMASPKESRQDTVPFSFGPPMNAVSQVVISIVESGSYLAPCV